MSRRNSVSQELELSEEILEKTPEPTSEDDIPVVVEIDESNEEVVQPSETPVLEHTPTSPIQPQASESSPIQPRASKSSPIQPRASESSPIQPQVSSEQTYSEEAFSKSVETVLRLTISAINKCVRRPQPIEVGKLLPIIRAELMAQRQVAKANGTIFVADATPVINAAIKEFCPECVEPVASQDSNTAAKDQMHPVFARAASYVPHAQLALQMLGIPFDGESVVSILNSLGTSPIAPMAVSALHKMQESAVPQLASAVSTAAASPALRTVASSLISLVVPRVSSKEEYAARAAEDPNFPIKHTIAEMAERLIPRDDTKSRQSAQSPEQLSDVLKPVLQENASPGKASDLLELLLPREVFTRNYPGLRSESKDVPFSAPLPQDGPELKRDAPKSDMSKLMNALVGAIKSSGAQVDQGCREEDINEARDETTDWMRKNLGREYSPATGVQRKARCLLDKAARNIRQRLRRYSKVSAAFCTETAPTNVLHLSGFIVETMFPEALSLIDRSEGFVFDELSRCFLCFHKGRLVVIYKNDKWGFLSCGLDEDSDVVQLSAWLKSSRKGSTVPTMSNFGMLLGH